MDEGSEDGEGESLGNLHDSLSAPFVPADKALDTRRSADCMEDAIGTLPTRDRVVICLLYALDHPDAVVFREANGLPDRAMKGSEIAEALGVNKQRVSQIKARAEKALREVLA